MIPVPLTLFYHLTHLLSLSCTSTAFTVLSASIIIYIYILADLTFFHSFSSLFIYFNNLIYASADPGSTHCQHCINMNAQCKLILSLFYKQLNCVLAASDIIAHSMGDSMTLIGLEHLFVGIMHHHHHCLCCSTASAPATTVINPFSSPAKFSHLVSVFKGILNILCYQICWSFLIEVKQN